MKIKCPTCGSDLAKQNLKGMDFPWKDFANVTLIKDIIAFKCPSCGEIELNRNQHEELDSAIEYSIRTEMLGFISKIKNFTSETQKDLAKIIGVSKEYFSELASSKKTPSFATYNLFKLVAANPGNFGIITKKPKDMNVLVMDCYKKSEKYSYLNEEEKQKIPRSSPLKLLNFGHKS